MRLDLLQQGAGGEDEHAGVPQMPAVREETFGGRRIRLFQEAGDGMHAGRVRTAVRRARCSHSRFRARSASCRTSRHDPHARPPRRHPNAAYSAGRSAIEASAAIIHSTASGSSSATSTAAAAMAGALLRPTGSSTIRASSMPTARSCSAIRNRCSWLQTTTGGANFGTGRAGRGLLHHGAVGHQRPELLRETLARHRPKPRAGTAGEDNGNDALLGHDSSPAE